MPSPSVPPTRFFYWVWLLSKRCPVDTSLWRSCRYLRFNRYQIESSFPSPHHLTCQVTHVPLVNNTTLHLHDQVQKLSFQTPSPPHIQGHLLTRSSTTPPLKALQCLPSCPFFTASWVHLTTLVSSCLNYSNSPTKGLHFVAHFPSPSWEQVGSTGRLTG